MSISNEVGIQYEVGIERSGRDDMLGIVNGLGYILDTLMNLFRTDI